MYNYTKKDLEKLAAETGFIRDNLEKVFRLCEILQYMNENQLLAEHLALKGGTAINLTVFNLPRLSVDIDLDFTKECSREEMLEIRTNINENLLNFMFAQGYALSPNTKNPHSLDSWVFYFQNSVGNRDSIRIEINYSMRNHIFPIEKRKIHVGLFNLIEHELNTLSVLELFGSKIKALIERTAARDLYDVQNMLKHDVIQPDKQDLLRKIIVFYLVLGAKNKIEPPFNFESIHRLKYNQIRANLIPVLRKSERFDFETAKTIVKGYLDKLMILTGNEKRFIENFNQGIYQPDLLFDDENIIGRIKEHPMAVWRINHIYPQMSIISQEN
ncbi:MAG: nucleotidyl transferase AbiEii/AbiGii toxin family protein [Prevotellaceae bacterium]|jgi:predicted nucleotidyltransferase component of viral defense system|nr:nucleotidyl transferase AbiEii/AbiGii toxin family protein [Prevotellaceae bacterium]